MRVAVLCVLLVFLAGGHAAAFEPAVFIVTPEEPAQGDIVRLTMNMPKRSEGGSVTFAGRTFDGFVSAGLLNVYVGIDMDTAPGAHDLKILYDTGDTGERELTIAKKDFAKESLQVESKFTDLDEPTQTRVGEESARLKALWNVSTPQRMWGKSFVKPAVGPNGSPFGLRRVFNGKPRNPHSGIDIKAPNGSDVLAANVGKVVLAADLFFTGNTVVVDHGLGLYTVYAHLSRIEVAEGDEVDRSQLLGRVGATGRVTGPHLHWAVKLGGARVDPAMLPGVVL